MKRLFVYLIAALLIHAAVLTLPIKQREDRRPPLRSAPVTIDLATRPPRPESARPQPKRRSLIPKSGPSQSLKPLKPIAGIRRPKLHRRIAADRLSGLPAPISPPPPEKPSPKRKPRPMPSSPATESPPRSADSTEPEPKAVAPPAPSPAPAGPQAAEAKPTQDENDAAESTDRREEAAVPASPVEPPEAAFDPPHYLHTPRPRYPRMARRLQYEGKVILEVEIDPRGRVLHAAVVHSSGYAILDDSAVEAVLDWRFEPARRGGRPVVSRVRVPIEFTLK